MLFDPSTADHLKPWLIRTLEPICDADPEALSDYILALLKHDAPETELRTELSSQLEEFLEKEGPSFIDTLFTVLRTKSYLPYTDAGPPPPAAVPTLDISVDNGIPIPLDALLSPAVPAPAERSRKRPGDYGDEVGGRPAKGPRLNHNDRFPRQGGGPSNGAWNGGGNMGGMMGGMNGRGGHQYQPPTRGRGICRDYHNNGFCSRGAYCKYSHGEDVFVPMFPVNAPFGPMFNGPGMFPMAATGGDATYDPHEAQMELRPPPGMGRGPRAPLLPRDADSSRTHGELPVIQDLTPHDAQGDVAMNGNGDASMAGPSTEGIAGFAAPVGVHTNNNMDVDTDGAAIRGPPRGGFRGRGRGSNSRPGTFNGDVQHFRPERRNDKTLVVEKIPEDKLSLDAVNEWFKKFGTVTNVAIDRVGAKALISFAENEHAHAAWKSEEAVFGNRFVKVFWHRPAHGQGQAGQRQLADSASTVASLSARGKQADLEQSDPSPSSAVGRGGSAESSRKPSANPIVSALAEKQQKLEQFIAEQKELMKRLKTASGDDKKAIFTRLRELGKEIEQTKSGRPASASTSTSQHPIPSTSTANVQRDLLDKELDLHSAAVDGDGGTTEALKAKLAKLKAEAASLGIDPSSTETAYPPRGTAPYRPYRGRGRGRGRGGFRGAMRGGPPPNMRLDNRPRKLLVRDVGPDAEQAVRDWFDATGQVEAFEAAGGGDFVITFQTRAAAEQGLAKGANIPLAGQKQISWYTPASSSSAPRKALPEDASASHSTEVEADRLGEDDVGPSGWGDATEDGMGML